MAGTPIKFNKLFLVSNTKIEKKKQQNLKFSIQVCFFKSVPCDVNLYDNLQVHKKNNTHVSI